MVRVIQNQTQERYQCEECGFEYHDHQWAEKCEVWCKEHKSCNLQITEHAIKEAND